MASTSLALQSVSNPSASLRCPSAQRSFSSNGVSLSLRRMQNSNTRLQISCQATPETVKRVVDIVTKQLAAKEGAVHAHSKFEELGADSLDQVEIVMALEEEFNITVDEEGAEAISTVQDAADLIDKATATKISQS